MCARKNNVAATATVISGARSTCPTRQSRSATSRICRRRLSTCQGVPYDGLLNVGANHVHQPYQNNGPTDIALDEGPCPSDRRHLVNLVAGHRIEVRAEAINLLNHFNRGKPAATLNNPATFGRITTTAGTPRIWQFALKYAF